MPITSIGSYDPTTTEFATNWEESNLELAPGAIVLAGNYTRASFVADRTTLLVSIDRVPTLAGDARFAASTRDNAKAVLMTRAKQFRGAVLSQITDTAYLDNLPILPKFGSDLSKFTEPLHAMTALWQRINEHAAALGITGELLLQDAYALGDFSDEIAELSVLTNTTERVDSAVGFARATRDNQMDAIYARMKQYRAAVPADLPETSPALQTLPRLTPPPGTTPPSLGATGVWNAQTLMADLSWGLSKAKEVLKVQVRGCTGGSYKADEEEVVADLPATATSWSGDWGLTAPGAIASFKVYVLTTTGNENGGKAIKIVRPAM